MYFCVVCYNIVNRYRAVLMATGGLASSLSDIEEMWVERVVSFSSEYNTST